MASVGSLKIVVSAPQPVIAALAKVASNLGCTSNVNGQNAWMTSMLPADAYNLLAQLVQAAAVGPISNTQCGTNTANSYTPAVSNNNLNNLLARSQPMNEMSVAADALALAIAKAVVEAMAQPQNRQLTLFPSDYQLPGLPLKYFLPFDKSASDIKNRNAIYIFGRVLKLPPTRALILERLLTVCENTLIPQQLLINDVYGMRGLTSETVWHAHMSYLRSAVEPELILETVKMQGYKVSLKLGMPFEQRCRTVAQHQLEQQAVPMEIEGY